MNSTLLESIISPRYSQLRCIFLLLTISSCVNSFAPKVPTTTSIISKNLENLPSVPHYDDSSKLISKRRSGTGLYATEKLAEPTIEVTGVESDSSSTSIPSRRHMARGLLLSSFSDGLLPNPQAVDFFMDSLVECMWNQHMAQLQQKVESSVMASPCCGPTDIDSFNQLLEADDIMKTQQPIGSGQWKVKFEKLLEQQDTLELRFLYIPTAMYAIRKDSNNTPGKQRQRARQDGKSRRTQIAQLIQDHFTQAYNEISGSSTDESPVNVLTITLDFDDDSLKQPEGSNDASKFPTTGMEALLDWNPHMIYVQGGNTFWLYHCMEKGNYKDALIKAITRGEDNESPALYCGTSAGAILAGSFMETATWKEWDDPTVDPNRPNYEDWKGIAGLDLIGENVSFFPHMTEQWQSMVDGKMEKMTSEAAISSDSSSPAAPTLYCLRDDQALCIDGIGIEPFRTLLQ